MSMIHLLPPTNEPKTPTNEPKTEFWPQGEHGKENRRKHLYPIIGSIAATAMLIAGWAGIRVFNQSELNQQNRHAAAAKAFAVECRQTDGILRIDEGANIRSSPHVINGVDGGNLIETTSTAATAPDGTTTQETIPVYLCLDTDGRWVVAPEKAIGAKDPAGPFGAEDDGFVAVNIDSGNASFEEKA